MLLAQDLKDPHAIKIDQGLKVFKIQRTCVYDGPGIRTTVFFQGCNMRCAWCQNPEMQPLQGRVGQGCDYSLDKIMDIVSRDKDFYTPTNGGVTLSGGEPFLQDPAHLLELLKALKKENFHVIVETSLFAPWKTISKAAPYIDLFLVDLKVIGDDDLHKKLTNQNSTLIHENLGKLLDLKVKIQFRMVMVPGLNDGESNIRKAADFLKSINFHSIELMKYHNLYEDKAKRLGLEFVPLDITPDQSRASIRKAVELFKQLGITAENTDLDTSRHPAEFTQRVKDIQKAQRDYGRAVCIEASKLKTQYYRKNGFKKPTPIHRAERLAYVLKYKKVIIYPGELLVGNFTAKRVACQLWEELYCDLPSVFFFRVNRLKPVSFKCSWKDILYAYFRIFPFWYKHGLFRKVFYSLKRFIYGIAHAAEMVAGFENNMAMIAHFIVNFERILQLGTTGIIDEIKAVQKEKPENNQDFYNGAIIALEALEAFAQRYADSLVELSKKESDPKRRKELEDMAEICTRVPKYPARTYHEALQSMLFLHIALCLESYENAISFGRVDQILYPYYKADLEAGRLDYERAKELLCLFILKIDEVFLINDGNSVLNLNRLFETMSVDQTMTFGGVDKDGNDATNDITYMLVDACELQPYSIDMSARVHENSPPRYLERIAEAYLNGSPQPKVNADNIYVESILRHYPVTVEQARNYSIVGCVEPAASDSHFGNTDCANMNLALPFLQALKGVEYELWHYGLGDQFEKLVTNFIENTFKGNNRISKAIVKARAKAVKRRAKKLGRFNYNPPSSMEELLDRFQARLNELAKSILADHQTIEQELRKNFTTPLASSLFKSCIDTGKDVYEGGTVLNSSGIQAVGVTDVADSLHALDEVVFKKHLYTIAEVIKAIDADFEGNENQRIKEALLAVPKFGDDSSREASDWVSKVMAIYNKALDSVENCPRNGRYSAGYYALNVATMYGKRTPTLPSGRLKGVPLANSIIPHYGMEQADLLSSLNAIAAVDFTNHADNGTTATLTIDSSLFQGRDGVSNLASILKTFLTKGGMQIQPNIINREILLDAYEHPEKYPYLMVRIAGYCAYFKDLTDDLKRSIINRTCYS
ncbi:MAG: pyruvate formate lyase family protein [Candidatus Sigynarchaeota archaeon]